MDPRFGFCRSADGTRIAYSVLGEGPPLLYARMWWWSMETHFRIPESRAFLERLASFASIVTFDRRGGGASERDVADLSFETESLDIASVADACRLDTFTLMGEASATAACAQFCISNPDRLEGLILWSPASYGDTNWAAKYREDWSYARRVSAGALFPDGPVSLQRAYSKGLRDTMSAEMAARRLEEYSSPPLKDLFPRVNSRVLVLESAEPAEQKQLRTDVASLLPSAELLFLGGPWSALTTPGPFAGAIAKFMGLAEGTEARTLVAVLFTDLVGHTEMMSRLGDERGRDVLREHERITREVLKANGGTEVKTMGDGFMASFGSVTKAVECAVALQKAVDEHNRGVGARRPPMQNEGAGSKPGSRPEGDPAKVDASPLQASVEPLYIRVGLNAGEPIEEDGDLFGATVILASRIAAKAEGGEILVADTVRGLCSGKGFLFADRGEFAAKGFEEPVRVYEVSWRA